MMQRKVTKGREALCGKLEDIQKGQVGLAWPSRLLTRAAWRVWLELEADWRAAAGWVAGGRRVRRQEGRGSDRDRDRRRAHAGGRHRRRRGAALLAQPRTNLIPSAPHIPGRQVIVTKGGDEETGAARVTADEWILQDMRRQQVHVYAHAHVSTACIGAGHASAACSICHVFRRMHVCASRRAAVSERIEVVTADKELRRKASDVHKNVKLINPVKWRAAHALSAL